MTTFTVSRLAYGNEPLQFGDLYTPTPGAELRPVVILIHGGFWRAAYDLSLMTSLAENLAQRGFAVWNIEYRRVGDAGGGWPGTLLDVARATDHLRTLQQSYSLDVQRIIPVGHSAGGHLALWLGARHKLVGSNMLTDNITPQSIKGAVSLAGAMDLKHVWQLHLGNDAAIELLGGDPTTVPERYMAASPAAHLPLGIPQVLIHGTLDDRVPLIVSQVYAAKARAVGDAITLIELPGADHFVLIDPASAAWATTVREVERLVSA
ncbi:MAG TPA: alpha/beta hydrolase [Ktedonobacteraceae bacterium]|nr:alpha/beta hydrolase [Ktedonobacteraceae bacterium]